MIHASDISRDLNNWIQEGEHLGEVHSIFKNTINIISEDGRFIPIYTHDKPMSPNSIRLKEVFDFKNLSIVMGEKGVFKKESFTSPGLNISYKDSKVWDNRLSLDFQVDNLDNVLEKIELVKGFLIENGNKTGIFSLMPFVPGNLFHLPLVEVEDKAQLFIKERFIKFLECFMVNGSKEINLFSKKIIGFGTGLTPSMDDFLSGMMIANLYMSYFLDLDLDIAYKLNKEIVTDIDNMTTRVSEEMLKLSSRGEGNEDVRNLMLFIVGESQGIKIKDLMSKVIDFGHSSGTDMLCGIYVGSCIKLNKKGGNSC